MGLHKHNFFPAMHGWAVFPSNERCSMQKRNMSKIDLFNQNKHNHQRFLRILVKFLRNNIKYVVSKAVSGALFRGMAIQSTFSDDSFN